MTKGLTKSCYKKSILYKKFWKSPSDVNKTRYITYRNKLYKSILHKAEKVYYNVQFNLLAGDLRKSWKLLRDVLHQNKSEMFPSEFHAESGEVITDTKEIADHFNEYFVNIGSKLAEQISSTGVSFSTFFKKFKFWLFFILSHRSS